MTKEIRSVAKLILLHLLPGIALCIMYIIFSITGVFEGHPRVVTLGVAMLFSNIPIEVGCLLYTAKKEEGSFRISAILGLKSRLKTLEFVKYTFLLLIIGAVLLIVLKPVSELLLKTVFCWIPDWYNFVQDMSTFPKKEIALATGVSFFILTIIVSVVEECYFRGFLLTRMKWMGKYAVLFNVIFYSAYHFYQPWFIVTRAVAMLPVYYYVNKKDSLRLGIVVHCLANFIDVISYMILLFSL